MDSNFSARRAARARSRSRVGMVVVRRVVWEVCRVRSWEEVLEADKAAASAEEAAVEALSAARSRISSK